MSIRNEIMEIFPEEEFLFADGFDEAIIGVDQPSMRIIYSYTGCLTVLQKDMSMDDAREYFEFNVSGAYVGEKTPIWCMDEFNN
jgi:hypothetical protein